MKKIWNWIINIFKPEKQDPHLQMYENVRLDKKEKIKRKYKDSSE